MQAKYCGIHQNELCGISRKDAILVCKSCTKFHKGKELEFFSSYEDAKKELQSSKKTESSRFKTKALPLKGDTPSIMSFKSESDIIEVDTCLNNIRVAVSRFRHCYHDESQVEHSRDFESMKRTILRNMDLLETIMIQNEDSECMSPQIGVGVDSPEFRQDRVELSRAESNDSIPLVQSREFRSLLKAQRATESGKKSSPNTAVVNTFSDSRDQHQETPLQTEVMRNSTPSMSLFTQMAKKLSNGEFNNRRSAAMVSSNPLLKVIQAKRVEMMSPAKTTRRRLARHTQTQKNANLRFSFETAEVLKLNLVDLSRSKIGDAQLVELTKLLLDGPEDVDFSSLNEVKHLPEVTEAASSGQNIDLDLSWNYISNTGAACIVQILTSPLGVTRLNLSQNSLKSEGLSNIAKSIKDNVNLETLILNNNLLDSKTLQALSASLRVNSSLEQINLCKTGLTDESMEYFAPCLIQNMTLRSLDVSTNSLGAEAISVLSKAVARNTSLRFLDLSNNAFGDEGAEAMFGALSRHPVIESVLIRSCSLSSASGKYLKQLLTVTTSLKKLDLGWNELADHGVARIAEGLSRNTSLQELSLVYNGIDHAGFKALGEVLGEGGASVANINLQANYASDLGADSLTKFLSTNRSLKELNLCDNKIKSGGVEALVNNICQNRSLGSLNLWDNPIGHEGAKHFLTLFNQNSTLETLHLRKNDITSSGVQTLSFFDRRIKY